jgi:NhaC family Na+:H+ antiporter
MESTKVKKEKRRPSPVFAVVSFLVIIATLVVLINLGVDTTMTVFVGAIISCIVALVLHVG